MNPTPRGATLLALSLALCVPAFAQTCPGVGNTFWKRDSLAQNPSGLTAVGVVPGLCEGEAAAVVFEMPANMAPQRLTQVVAPWGHAPAGTSGFVAALDVEIYDGVSFAGGTPIMGSPVFTLSGTGQSLQVQSHALNTFDITPYEVIVGLAPATGSPPVRRFAVAFRVEINAFPGGSCATGYFANFFTDAQASFGTCITPIATSLLDQQGVGWTDMKLANVGGFPICPFAFNGTWCIRACSEDAYPASYTTIAAGCPGTFGVSQLIPATLPRIGTSMLVIVNNMAVSLGIMLMGFTNFAPPIDMTFLDMTACPLHTSFEFTYSLVGGGGQAVHTLILPNDPTLLSLELYQQALSFDAINPFGAVLSDAAKLVIGI